MNSLFLRIFVLFWIAMALIVGGSIAITFAIAAREYEPAEQLRRPGVAIQASEVLASGGVGALRDWLGHNEHPFGDHDLYIVGPDGRDLLGRRLSEGAAHRLALFNRATSAPDRVGTAPAPPPPPNFRPPHVAPQILGADGAAYTVLLMPRRPSIFGALSLPGIALRILAVALVISALASGWLARRLSAPIRRIQAAARALATQDLAAQGLDTRVSAGLESRRYEVAVLARDFDAMADRLRANRAAVTRLLRDISHELRSPLARLRVAVGLARQTPADPQRHFERMESEIERLDAMIGQVLKLARLHGSDDAFGREPFDLDELLEEVVRDANFEAEAKGCSVVQDGAARVTIGGNRELLRSAVENVLRNAVRYSPAGSVVEVRVAGPRGAPAITVRDHGPGVPEADLERIFEPFFRVAESRDRDSGGEGIGLAITAQVMRAHGGGAVARNAPGGGLEVRLTLPSAAPGDRHEGDD